MREASNAAWNAWNRTARESWNFANTEASFYFLGARFVMFIDVTRFKINVYCDALPNSRPLCSLDMNYQAIERYVRQNKEIKMMLIGQTL